MNANAVVVNFIDGPHLSLLLGFGSPLGLLWNVLVLPSKRASRGLCTLQPIPAFTSHEEEQIPDKQCGSALDR
jgi:hypothetical protein